MLADGVEAAEPLSGILGHLAPGGGAPHDFNEAWLAVIPKGVQAEDVGMQGTRASVTHPMALKHVHAKAAARAMA